MTPFLHIANTCFETELTDGGALHSLLEKNPIFLQLQFLPLLYKQPIDGVGVSHLPYPPHPDCYLLEQKTDRFTTVESWGASRAVAAWALEHHLAYRTPPWEVVQQVNSKQFSFLQAPQLPGAALLHSMEELEQWDRTTPGEKLLKTCFGVSGRGHLRLPSPKMNLFARREFSAGRPIIGEPWVDKLLDFSTQWKIDSAIHYLGATHCITNPRGSYTATVVGPHLFDQHRHHLEHHNDVVLPILSHMQQLGYFGHVGIDAMVWGDNRLHPVVEINARKTMGWVALEFAKHHSTKQTIRLSYSTNERGENKLPSAVVKRDGSLLHFDRSLTINTITG